MSRRRAAVGLMVASTVLLAGCGSTAQSSTSQSSTRSPTASTAAASTPTGSTTPARSTTTTAASPSSASAGDAAQVQVIRDWAAALQQGHIKAAAAFFARPSVFANGVTARGQLEAYEIRTEAQAEAINESLSCGAKLVSTQRDGKFITANFTLTNRKGPGADCGSGTGEPAATDFVIKHGRIVDWIRAPANPSTTPTVPAKPTAPPPPSQQI